MLAALARYDNLGNIAFFYELFTTLKNSDNSWSKTDISKLFYNRIVQGRYIHDGGLDFAIAVGLLDIDSNENISLSPYIIGHLFSQQQMADRIIEKLFLSISDDSVFFEIFSPKHLSFEVLQHTIQLSNQAFGFRYSNFKQLLLDFNVLLLHPDREIKRYLLNTRYKKLFDKIILPIIRRKAIGVTELKEMLEQRQIWGYEAEKFVLLFEEKRLGFRDGIDWVAEYSIAEGFDISSFHSDKSAINDRFIEVKSYSGRPHFYWSKNEVRTAQMKGDNYFIYLVNRDEMRSPDYKPLMIQNPIVSIMQNNDWVKEIDKYKIYLAS